MVIHSGRAAASWTYFDGQWLEGNPMFMGPGTHAPGLGSLRFLWRPRL